jgi:5-methylcytosine-specific restriction endonuclease McrA
VRATEVDHIGDHDDHSPGNLQAACSTCHRTKTGRAAARIGNAQRAERKRPTERHPGLID